MKSIGQILLWAGFLVGALATVFHAPSAGVKHVIKVAEKAEQAPGKMLKAKSKLATEESIDPKSKKVAQLKKEIDALAKEADPIRGFDFPDGLTEFEVPEESWKLIPWNWYLGAVFVSIIGVAMMWKARFSEGQKSEQSEASLSEIKTSLSQLISDVAELGKDAKKIAPSKIVERIDEVLAEDLRTFAEGRDSITAELSHHVRKNS